MSPFTTQPIKTTFIPKKIRLFFFFFIIYLFLRPLRQSWTKLLAHFPFHPSSMLALWRSARMTRPTFNIDVGWKGKMCQLFLSKIVWIHMLRCNIRKVVELTEDMQSKGYMFWGKKGAEIKFRKSSCLKDKQYFGRIFHDMYILFSLAFCYIRMTFQPWKTTSDISFFTKIVWHKEFIWQFLILSTSFSNNESEISWQNKDF